MRVFTTSVSIFFAFNPTYFKKGLGNQKTFDCLLYYIITIQTPGSVVVLLEWFAVVVVVLLLLLLAQLLVVVLLLSLH